MRFERPPNASLSCRHDADAVFVVRKRRQLVYVMELGIAPQYLAVSLRISSPRNFEAKISLAVESLRLIAPGVAIEEGRLTWFADGVEATVESIYRVAHVKRAKSG